MELHDRDEWAEPGLLFFDEFNLTSPEIRQAVEIMLRDRYGLLRPETRKVE